MSPPKYAKPRMSEVHRRITDVRAVTDGQQPVKLILRGLALKISMSTPRTDHTSPLPWDFRFALGPLAPRLPAPAPGQRFGIRHALMGWRRCRAG